MKFIARISQNSTGQGGLQARTPANKTVKQRLEESKDDNFFLFLWLIFTLLNPDPNSESGSTDLIESGSKTQGDSGDCGASDGCGD
jgi:hypothetical protein